MLRLIRSALIELRHAPTGQAPALDFLRTLAVLLVVVGHVDAAFARVLRPTVLSQLPFVRNGWVGVDLFFVLSGYLIGRQIWNELQKTGTIHVGAFLLRRGLRIWPLYFFVFTVCILLGAGTATHWWSDVVFLTNYFRHNGVVRGSWSLCTEEHFYILAPALVLLGCRLRWKPSAYRYVLAAVLLAEPMLRSMEWLYMTKRFFAHDQHAWEPIYYNFHTHCDGLALGLLLAHFAVFGLPRWAEFLNSKWAPVCALVIFGALWAVQREVFAFTGLTVVFGSMLWFAVTHPLDLKFTKFPPFYWASRLSFGIYLNHDYLVDPLLRRLYSDAGITRELLAIAIVICASAALAVVTFVLIEHPFLELRKRLLRTKRFVSSSGRTLANSQKLSRMLPMTIMSAVPAEASRD
ncbi:MAG: acyltransferase [Acidobacteriaceae bacterium]|nr:acyltransferase [Acidobacteriaceae bacterium]